MFRCGLLSVALRNVAGECQTSPTTELLLLLQELHGHRREVASDAEEGRVEAEQGKDAIAYSTADFQHHHSIFHRRNELLLILRRCYFLCDIQMVNPRLRILKDLLRHEFGELLPEVVPILKEVDGALLIEMVPIQLAAILVSLLPLFRYHLLAAASQQGFDSLVVAVASITRLCKGFQSFLNCCLWTRCWISSFSHHFRMKMCPRGSFLLVAGSCAFDRPSIVVSSVAVGVAVLGSRGRIRRDTF
mmetsp:Transcript_78976/g.164045  ORF Transcript_78976/g.164045 Transcript_78976/m.164045 type:complete len:246 (+) Transcript_78976:173-910(+)